MASDVVSDAILIFSASSIFMDNKEQKDIDGISITIASLVGEIHEKVDVISKCNLCFAKEFFFQNLCFKKEKRF